MQCLQVTQNQMPFGASLVEVLTLKAPPARGAAGRLASIRG